MDFYGNRQLVKPVSNIDIPLLLAPKINDISKKKTFKRNENRRTWYEMKDEIPIVLNLKFTLVAFVGILTAKLLIR